MKINDRLIALIEQHDYYDLGDSWSVSRNKGRWLIYFRGKHIDCWKSEYEEKDVPRERELTTYDCVLDAIIAADQFKTSETWYLENYAK
jgi:hypothetical protein